MKEPRERGEGGGKGQNEKRRLGPQFRGSLRTWRVARAGLGLEHSVSAPWASGRVCLCSLSPWNPPAGRGRVHTTQLAHVTPGYWTAGAQLLPHPTLRPSSGRFSASTRDVGTVLRAAGCTERRWPLPATRHAGVTTRRPQTSPVAPGAQDCPQLRPAARDERGSDAWARHQGADADGREPAVAPGTPRPGVALLHSKTRHRGKRRGPLPRLPLTPGAALWDEGPRGRRSLAPRRLSPG